MPDSNTPDTNPMLDIINASVGYQQQTLIKAINFQLTHNEIGCLLGPSGCGKSTLLRCIAGFETLISGEIKLAAKTLDNTQTIQAAEKRPIGMMFQDNALFPHLSALKNVTFGLHHLSKDTAKAQAMTWLDRVGLADKAQSLPHELSGGEQQRVALARAIAPQPKLVLLDEPFSSLDADLREFLSREVRDILKTEKITALLVTHDQDEAFAMADKIGVIQAGTLQQWDSAYNLYHQPISPHVANFIGHGSFIRGQIIANGKIRTALGEIALTTQQTLSNTLPGQTVKALLRPDHLQFDDDKLHNAEVIAKWFKGGKHLYELKLTSGEIVLALAPSHHNYPIGHTSCLSPKVSSVVAYSA